MFWESVFTFFLIQSVNFTEILQWKWQGQQVFGFVVAWETKKCVVFLMTKAMVACSYILKLHLHSVYSYLFMKELNYEIKLSG